MDQLYDLTPMIGKDSTAKRTVVIQTFEVNARVATISMIALFPALIIGLILAAIIGTWGFLATPALVLGAVWFFHARSRRGLGLRHWEEFRDRLVADENKVFLCGREVTFDVERPWRLISASVPLPRADPDRDGGPAPEATEDLFGFAPAPAPERPAALVRLPRLRAARGEVSAFLDDLPDPGPTPAETHRPAPARRVPTDDLDFFA